MVPYKPMIFPNTTHWKPLLSDLLSGDILAGY